MGPISAATTTEEIYDQSAAVYDQLTAHHDYELWLGNLLPALESQGLQQGRLLDVACGTGKSFLPMLRRGWAVTGVDVSTAMLDKAKAKVNGSVRLEVHDMRRLPQLGQFDLAWCLDDAVNYLLVEAELVACFSGLRDNLADGGLCVFDLNTVAAYRWFWAETSTIKGPPELIWSGNEGPDFTAGDEASATLEVAGCADHRGELITHRQRHFPPQSVLSALAESGLEVLALHGITTEAVLEQPLDETRHTKAIYIAQKEARR